MPTDAGLVTQLCERWEEARARGQNLALEELCRDYPELSDEVRRAIQHLEAADRAIAREAGGTDPELAALPPTRPTDILRPRPGSSADPDLPTLPPGCRYRLIKFLAQGGLGRVYAGDDLELGREVAVKFVRPDRAGLAALARFRREAEITGRLEHPGIAPVYGLVELPDGGFCYAMRLLRGETLSAAIDRLYTPANSERPAALRKLLRHFVSVCDAVAFAHSRGIIHRDLKPANVMLGQFGETWVLDWGLAKTAGRGDAAEGVAPPRAIVESSNTPLADQTVPGSAIGTPGFMSPEQSRGETNMIGPAADVFSLGATLGSILVGRGPHSGERTEAWFAEASQGAPAALLAVCRKAMAGDVSERYRGARELAADVERWLADEPVGVYRDPFPERARRWAKRNRGAVIGLSALLLAAAPLSAALALVSDRARRQAVDDQRRVEAEKEEADRQRDLAQRERDEAERQRTAALANFDLAFQVMDDTSRTMAEDLSFQNPNLLPLRKSIEARLRSYYDNLATRYRDDPKLREYRAVALLNLGLIQVSEGQEDAARESFAEAENLARTLVAENPDKPEYWVRLAAITTAVAMQHSRTNSGDNLPARFRTATDLWQRAITAKPDDIRCRAGLTATRAAFAIHLIKTKQYDNAIGQLEVAIQEQEENERRPNWPDRTERVGGLFALLGQAHRQNGQFPKAEVAYRNAITQHDKALAKSPGDVHTQYLRATRFSELGQLYLNWSATDPTNLKKAWEALADGERLFVRLVEENPTQWRFAHDHLYTLQYMVGLTEMTDRSKALGKWAEALTLGERYAKAFPEIEPFKVFEVSFRVKVANHNAEAGHSDRAIEDWTTALRQAEQLLKGKVSFESSYGLRANILEAGYGLGSVHTRAKRPDLAESALRTAVEAGRELRAAPIQDPRTLGGLIRTNGLFGELLAERKDYQGAITAFTTALETVRLLPLAFQIGMGREIRRVYVGRAHALSHLGKHAEAVAEWERIVAMSSGADRTQAEFRRALTRFLGSGTEATLTDLERLPVPKDAPAVLFYDVACVYAVAATAVQKAETLAPNQKSAKAEDFRKQAVATLRLAHARKFFQDPAVIDHMNNDPELESLRDGPDFKMFLAELKPVAKK